MKTTDTNADMMEIRPIVRPDGLRQAMVATRCDWSLLDGILKDWGFGVERICELAWMDSKDTGRPFDPLFRGYIGYVQELIAKQEANEEAL